VAGRRASGPETALAFVQQRCDEAALVAEAPVHRAHADARGLRDVANVDGFDARLGHQPLGGGQHALAVAQRVPALAHGTGYRQP